MIPVLAQMEAHGVWVDDEKLADIEAQLQNDVETLTKQIFATT